MSNEISNIQNWFVAAKPNHTLEDACVQIGCHFEEVAEMIESIFGSENQAFKVVNELAVMFKQKRHPGKSRFAPDKADTGKRPGIEFNRWFHRPSAKILSRCPAPGIPQGSDMAA